jgi:hypothetical protein
MPGSSNISFNSRIAEMMGATAWEFCSKPSEGKVLASVSDAVYLVSREGNLFWIISENIPLHFRSIRIRGRLNNVKEGISCSIQPDQITFTNGLKIHLVGAHKWQPEIPAPRALLPFSSIYKRAKEVFRSLANIIPKGFGQLIPGLLQEKINHPFNEGFVDLDPILQRAWKQIQIMVKSNPRQDVEQILKAAEMLVGLGSGLTPSGDDFLGGLFFTFHFMNSCYPDDVKFDRSPFREFLNRNLTRTNIISQTLLQDLTFGCGPAPLHDFMNSLVSNKSFTPSLDYDNGITAIGNSTGWDMMTGVLAGYLLIYRYPVDKLYPQIQADLEMRRL